MDQNQSSFHTNTRNQIYPKSIRRLEYKHLKVQ